MVNFEGYLFLFFVLPELELRLDIDDSSEETYELFSSLKELEVSGYSIDSSY